MYPIGLTGLEVVDDLGERAREISVRRATKLTNLGLCLKQRERQAPHLLSHPRLEIDRGTLDCPGRTIRVLHFGRAHTRGDVIVYLPDEGIVAVGDLVEDAFPYFGNACPQVGRACSKSSAGSMRP